MKKTAIVEFFSATAAYVLFISIPADYYMDRNAAFIYIVLFYGTIRAFLEKALELKLKKEMKIQNAKRRKIRRTA